MSSAGSGLDEMLDVAWVRSQFPSLETQVDGQTAAFLDGPAGTQVPTEVMAAIQGYLLNSNANTDGAFLTSRRSDEMIADTRAAMADFLHCESSEVVFGQNMTTLTLAMSRAIGRELRPGDEILLTTLDHDANFSPWKALEEKGVVITGSGHSRGGLHARPRGPEKQIEPPNATRGRRLCVQRGRNHQSSSRDHAPGPCCRRNDIR